MLLIWIVHLPYIENNTWFCAFKHVFDKSITNTCFSTKKLAFSKISKRIYCIKCSPTLCFQFHITGTTICDEFEEAIKTFISGQKKGRMAIRWSKIKCCLTIRRILKEINTMSVWQWQNYRNMLGLLRHRNAMNESWKELIVSLRTTIQKTQNFLN